MQTYFTCYIEGRGDRWQAACMDFDLAVSGRSLDEVKNLLDVAVRTYVADISAEAEPARTRLLKRRAPALVQLQWRGRVFLSRLGIGNNTSLFEGRYAMACPA